MGYPASGMRNYLARLGWSHGDQEIFSRQELVELFDVTNVNSKAARLDMAKLGWVNQHYLKTDDPATIAPQLVYQLEKLGLDVAAGPAPVDVVETKIPWGMADLPVEDGARRSRYRGRGVGARPGRRGST